MRNEVLKRFDSIIVFKRNTCKTPELCFTLA